MLLEHRPGQEVRVVRTSVTPLTYGLLPFLMKKTGRMFFLTIGLETMDIGSYNFVFERYLHNIRKEESSRLYPQNSVLVLYNPNVCETSQSFCLK